MTVLPVHTLKQTRMVAVMIATTSKVDLFRAENVHYMEKVFHVQAVMFAQILVIKISERKSYGII